MPSYRSIENESGLRWWHVVVELDEFLVELAVLLVVVVPGGNEPRAALPTLLSACSEVASPVPRILVFAGYDSLVVEGFGQRSGLRAAGTK